jgi:hypothetical protein
MQGVRVRVRVGVSPAGGFRRHLHVARFFWPLQGVGTYVDSAEDSAVAAAATAEDSAVAEATAVAATAADSAVAAAATAEEATAAEEEEEEEEDSDSCPGNRCPARCQKCRWRRWDRLCSSCRRYRC